MNNFTLIKVVIPWHIRLYSRFAAMHDNRVLFRQFKLDLHLDKLEKEKISYKLPSTYPISTNELTRLYNVRDRIIIKIHHDDYSKKQIAIDNDIKKLEDEHALLQNRLAFEKEDLSKLRIKKQSTTDSNDIIALESRISKAESAIQNTESTIKKCETQTAELIRTRKKNLSNWAKQIAFIEKTVELSVESYIKNATKKIETTYGFTEFVHAIGRYDEEMQILTKGEY